MLSQLSSYPIPRLEQIFKNFAPIDILTVTGAATASYFAWRILRFIHLYFLRPSGLYRYRAVTSPQGEAPWAFITGSSDGIGKALAAELASHGFNIIVHGQTPSKIAKVASDLENTYKVKTRTLSLNACDYSLTIDDAVNAALGDIKPTILINNVGGIGAAAKRVYDPLVERSSEEIDQIFSLNGRFMTQMMRIIIPRMTEPGVVINVSSSSSFGLPWVQLYSGAKGYVNSLSIALNTEMYATGRDIQVMAVTPGSVAGTPGFVYATGPFIPDTRTISKAILNRIGCGRPVLSPHWFQAIQELVFKYTPPTLYKKLTANILRDMKAIEDKDLAQRAEKHD
ncbi:hypothetical protein H072_7819 [Dactylellina haptotyla CBS 200.50]|uniref:Uncharacterized protein n=1 Tax=Dactylellina haptotyla (strain CBS 200.50) TaxID=1284197 RepID=S8A5Z2_DACHA|nr:hypothetical protein H072_7819 [Dactylellina haptotyla CBS 200.50]